MNIKNLLIEKEQAAYIAADPVAPFFGATLDYILELEERINKKDAALERIAVAADNAKEDE